MTEIIKAENVRKTFDNRIWVLDGIDLVVQKGDFVSIVGASGSGKSTLLTILGGMDKPTQGKVFFDGEDITEMKEDKLAKLRRTKLGFVFQFFNLAPYLTVEENILLPIILNGRKQKDVQERLDYLLKYLAIEEYRKSMPSKISGGEQQRVAIARALIYEPAVIFLDEPTGNLDSKSSQNIMELLLKINKEMDATIVQVTHSAENAAYGNRIIKISDGKIEPQ
ncbi:MAG: ABC transporter ATP-binding protein [Christensenellales bacterium]|jgi:putative ABC transport system ATP-binding protein|nr:ABC transporter ATP-binding protein [Clostridiales bacterium]